MWSEYRGTEALPSLSDGGNLDVPNPEESPPSLHDRINRFAIPPRPALSRHLISAPPCSGSSHGVANSPHSNVSPAPLQRGGGPNPDASTWRCSFRLQHAPHTAHGLRFTLVKDELSESNPPAVSLRLPRTLESHLQYGRMYFGAPLTENAEPPFPFSFTIHDAEDEWLPQVCEPLSPAAAQCTLQCTPAGCQSSACGVEGSSISG